MPQQERTRNIIALLKWLCDQKTALARGPIIYYIKMEITEMGATERTAISYLRDCVHYNLVEEKAGKFQITRYGRSWLKRHSH